MKKLDRRLLRMIRQSKGQFISIVTIVAAALSLYILFSTTTINIKSAVADYYKQTNVNDIQVQLVKVPQNVLGDLASLKGVVQVSGRVSMDVPLKTEEGNGKVSMRLISAPDQVSGINKLYFQSAAVSNLKDNEILVLDQFATARAIKVSDPLTPFINGRDHHLKVAGIVSSPEFIYLMENEQALLPNPDKFGIGYISERYAQSSFGFAGSYNEVLIKISADADVDQVSDEVERFLKPYGVKRVTPLKDQLSHNVLTQKIEGIDKMAGVLPVMFLMVGALIIVIMLTRTVNNDRIPIGVLKALGYSNGHILLHYTKYALAIGLTGAIVGVTSGLLLSKPLSEVFVFYFNIPFVSVKVYPLYVLNALVLTSVFCIGSGLMGARSVLSIMPADAMRAESPKAGHRIWLEQLPFLWRRIAFSWKMVIRNISRSKKRFVMLSLGLALAYGINLVPLYMAAAMPIMFTEQYQVFQKMDYGVDFKKPMNERVKSEVKALIGNPYIEAKAEFPFEFRNQWYKKNTILIGYPEASEIYQLVNLQNQPVSPQAGGVLITESLAKALRVTKGDYITIKNFMPQKDEVQVQVTEIVKQHLGSNAYMSLDTMQRLLLDRQFITGLNIRSGENVKDSLKDVPNIAAVRSSHDISNAFLEYLDTIIVATNAYMLFGGILGFAIVYNATIIGISERKMEFASLRVLGFYNKEIFTIVIRENILLTALAVLIGMPLGAGMISAMAVAFSSDMMTLPVVYKPSIFINAGFATLFFVAIAQVAARKKIYQMDFIDALKSRIS